MPKTQAELYTRVIDINRRACHHRGLGSNYGYNAILDANLVRVCLVLRQQFPPPIRVLDIGCGDGLALRQLGEGLVRAGACLEDFELWGMGLNRYHDMYIEPNRFIESGLNAYVTDGTRFHLVVSVFTFQYLWHKLEGVEKVHNELLEVGGYAYLHFPGYLVRWGESYDALNQTEEEGNGLFAAFLARMEEAGAICPMHYHLVPYISDDDDCAMLAEFGNLHFEKTWDRPIAFRQNLKAFALFTKGFARQHMNFNPPTYVAAHYDAMAPDPGVTPSAEPPPPPYRIASIPSTIPRRTFQVDVAIHAADSDSVILICPGAFDSLAGRAIDYAPVAEQIRRDGLGAVVRYDDPYDGQGDYPAMVVENLRQVLAITLASARSFCATDSPRVSVMAYSSSSGALASLVTDYPCIDAILLVAPSFDVPREVILPSLSQFRGEVYVLIGDTDQVVLPQQAFWYYQQAVSARHREYVEVPCCGHDFRGEANRSVFHRAPLWAFGNTRPKDFPPPSTTYSECH